MEGTAAAYVDGNEEGDMEMRGYRPCGWKLALVLLGSVCSGGFLRLFLHWLPELSVKWTCRAVPLCNAQIVLLRTTDEFQTRSRERVHSLSAPGTDPLGFPQRPENKGPLGLARRMDDVGCEEQLLSPLTYGEQVQVCFFTHHNVRYLWDAEAQAFRRLSALDRGQPCSSLHFAHRSGLPRGAQVYRIDVQVPSLAHLLIKEVLNPFYIFQAFSIVLWSLDDYYLYASAILFMSFVSICSSLYTIRKVGGGGQCRAGGRTAVGTEAGPSSLPAIRAAAGHGFGPQHRPGDGPPRTLRSCGGLSPNGSTSPNATAPSDAGGWDYDSVRSYENTTLFFLSCFQYVFVALTFSTGRPFRQPTQTNGPFLTSLLLVSGFLLLLLLWPLPVLDRLFQLACIPYKWRLVLLALAFSNLALSLCLETFVCDCEVLWQRLCSSRQKEDCPRQAAFPQLELGELGAPMSSCCRQAAPQAKYQRLAQELLFDPDWPPQPKTSTLARGPPAETHA